MRSAPKVIGLEHLGIVRMRGADAVKFLQGQVSNDVARLSADRSMLAGYHNPQGRVIALLRLVQWGADDILAMAPRELAPVIATRLSKFVLRAKVKVADESAGWQVNGLVGDAPGDGVVSGGRVSRVPHDGGVAGGTAGGDALGPRDLPAAINGQVRGDGAVFVCVGNEPSRWLAIAPADRATPASNSAPRDRQIWRQLEVAGGQPQVFGATSEEFVAQMLNLDVVDAIAFDKGCYTGQEVIARAHYRGRVKRRMQRFISREPCQLSPGDSGQLADGRTFKVVLAAQLADGRCDFLAVAPPVDTTVEPAPAPPAPGAASAPATQIVSAEQAPLPYALPD